MTRPFSQYRSAQLRALQTQRSARAIVPLLALAGLAAGLYIGSAGPGENWSLPLFFAVLAPAAFVAYRLAQAANRARTAFLTDWAGEHGFTYTTSPEQRSDCRFMRQGHGQRFVEAFVGHRPEGAVEVANFRYSEGSGRSERTIQLTAACVACALPGIGHLLLEPRGLLSAGVFDSLESTFTRDRVVELESVEFGERYRLLVDDEASDLAVRTVFTPKAMTALIDHPDAKFEVAGGALWVWAPGWFGPNDVDGVEELLQRAIDVSGCLVQR